MKETNNESLANLNVCFIGDLKNGRTVHSLVKLLRLMGNRDMTFIAPPGLKLPQNLLKELQIQGVNVYETDDILDGIRQADVLYVTRIQKERFSDEAAYQEACRFYQINPELMRFAKPQCVVMHLLPRIEGPMTEISPRFDSDPRAAYFRQVENGIHVRMALLYLTLVRR